MLLAIVEDSFEVENRGLIVVPGPKIDTFNGPQELIVMIKTPDGGKFETELNVEHFFQTPPQRNQGGGFGSPN